MEPKPRVSFVFPYRWLKEDKEFLDENLRIQFERDWGTDHRWELAGIPAYRVNLVCRSRKPMDITLSKTFIQKTFKSLFPIGKCIDVNVDFKQLKSQTILPTVNFEMYF